MSKYVYQAGDAKVFIDRINLCEIDVAGESGFAGAIQKSQQVCAFGLSSAAANENNQAGMGMRRCQGQKIIPVARHHQHGFRSRVSENFLIAGPNMQNLAQFDGPMSFGTKHAGNFRRHVMVQKKSHEMEAYTMLLICRATSASISPRWSS